MADDREEAPPSPQLDRAVVDRLCARTRQLLPLGTLAGEERAPEEAELRVLAELAERLAHNYPFHDRHYAGQMLKPPHPLAWAAYATTMLLNPNNHALDGGPATAAMEREAVAALAGMLGLDRHLGHLTASGTIANLEALWVARELRPHDAIVSAANAHYTHARMCRVLGVRHETLPEDARGRLDLDALAERLARCGVGTVVATLGTTPLGALDDVAAIAGLCERHGARLHVDAAYGGFFRVLADGGEPRVAAAPFGALARADSIVIDPHKHGLQPYGCGCVVFADPAVAGLYAHSSPYTYFSSSELHLGEISLECSRAGAAAAALWATLRLLPPSREGLGTGLAASLAAARTLAGALERRVELVVRPQLDIVCSFAPLASATAITAASERAFGALAADGWHVAKLRLDAAWLRQTHPDVAADAPHATVLRCCLMKPEHAAVAPQLADAIAAALGAR